MFENEYTITKELIKEYVNNFLCKKYSIIGYIIAILGLIMFLFTKDLIMLIVAFVCILAAILTPITATKQLFENSKRLNNGKIEKTYIKFAENIIMDEGKAHFEFEYAQIKKVLQTKNFIILKTSNQTAILVLKEGFVKGNKEQFITFINEKIMKNKRS